jgi:hypothetical protein
MLKGGGVNCKQIEIDPVGFNWKTVYQFYRVIDRKGE